MKANLRVSIFVGLMGLLLTGTTRAEDLFIVGVGTHLMESQTLQKRALQSAADAGITSVRDDAFWSTAEPERNQLRILPS